MFDLTLDKIQLFAAAVLPGMIALFVYGVFHPRQKRDPAHYVAEVAVFSFINLVLWGVPLWRIQQANWPQEHTFIYILQCFGMLVISPAVIGGLCAIARGHKWVTHWIGHPVPNAWNDFFNKCPCCFVRLHLKSGGMVAGYFGERSYATTFPDEPELYLEEAWDVDEKGVLTGRTVGTFGLLIKQSECGLIEFVAVEPEPATAPASPKTESVQTTEQKEPVGNGQSQ